MAPSSSMKTTTRPLMTRPPHSAPGETGTSADVAYIVAELELMFSSRVGKIGSELIEGAAPTLGHGGVRGVEGCLLFGSSLMGSPAQRDLSFTVAVSEGDGRQRPQRPF